MKLNGTKGSFATTLASYLQRAKRCQGRVEQQQTHMLLRTLNTKIIANAITIDDVILINCERAQ